LNSTARKTAAGSLELPGVMCCGDTRDDAIRKAESLVIEVIADRIAHGELSPDAWSVSFTLQNEPVASR
jgi:predicted RNase H-like HicB family nuclease